MSKQESGIFSGLRLAEEKTREVLDRLDKPVDQGAYHARGVRSPRRVYDLHVALTQPGGSRIEYLVVTRNLSTQGLAFLHGNYVHVGSLFECELPSLDGGTSVRLRGKVIRCRHVTGFVHEVAVMFDAPIDLANFTRLSPEEEERCWQSRHGATGESEDDIHTRSCLVIDEAKSQRAIAGVWLGRLGYKAVEAESGEAALNILKGEPVDLILLDLMLGESSGIDLCGQIRSAGFAGTIIATTAETDSDCHRQAIDAGCDATLIKPMTGRGLHEVLERLRTSDHQQEDQGALHSSLSEDPSMVPLIDEYVQNVKATINKYVAACESQDLARLRVQCLTLRAEGGAHGFWQITRAAEAVLSLLDTQGSQTDIQRASHKLQSVLRRVTTG